MKKSNKLPCPDCGLPQLDDSGVDHLFGRHVKTCHNCRAFYIQTDGEHWTRLIQSDEHLCKEHGRMVLTEISQGEIVLGYAWFCMVKECGEADDCDETTEVPSNYPKKGEPSRFAERQSDEIQTSSHTRPDVSGRTSAGAGPAEAEAPKRTPRQLDLPLTGRHTDNKS